MLWPSAVLSRILHLVLEGYIYMQRCFAAFRALENVGFVVIFFRTLSCLVCESGHKSCTLGMQAGFCGI